MGVRLGSYGEKLLYLIVKMWKSRIPMNSSTRFIVNIFINIFGNIYHMFVAIFITNL